jgi:hypothetical protein
MYELEGRCLLVSQAHARHAWPPAGHACGCVLLKLMVVLKCLCSHSATVCIAASGCTAVHVRNYVAARLPAQFTGPSWLPGTFLLIALSVLLHRHIMH